MANAVIPENERLEYKSLWIEGRCLRADEVVKMFQKSEGSEQKEFNAMLNCGGGEVHFGIGEMKPSDDSKLSVFEEGIKLTDAEKKRIDEAIHRTFAEFQPPCSSDRGDYKIEWKTDPDKAGGKRYRFAVIVNRCSAFDRGHLVYMNNVSRAEAYTRSGSASVPISADSIREKIKHTAMVGDYVRWTQASIDARLIQKLRDTLDRTEIKIQPEGIVPVLQQYLKEIGRQKYNSYSLAEEVINVMDRLAHMLQFKGTEIKVAAELLNLCNCIYFVYELSQPWYGWSDSELSLEADDHKCLKNLAINTISRLFDVCFSIACNSVKYHRDEIFARATPLLAKFLGTIQSASRLNDDKWIISFRQRYENLLDSTQESMGQRYKHLQNVLQESVLDGALKGRLLELHKLLQELYYENDLMVQFSIEERIIKLGYDWC